MPRCMPVALSFSFLHSPSISQHQGAHSMMARLFKVAERPVVFISKQQQQKNAAFCLFVCGLSTAFWSCLQKRGGGDRLSP